MATPQRVNEPKIALEIRTKSVEQTLIPLVTQITTLVNAKEKPCKSEKTLRALLRVGQAVNLAVERFVTVGESIAEENAEIQQEMKEACTEARVAGIQIAKLTDVKLEEMSLPRSIGEKTAMVRAARQLLSAITKVLILADKIVVKQVILAKDKVYNSLRKIEGCASFTEFVQHFSQFGNEMVELAQVSGERQNDLKNDKCRAQIGAARSVLEKSTMMLLTTSKALLRHTDCSAAKQNRDLVLAHMRRALDVIHQVVLDAGPASGDMSPSAAANGDSGISLAQHQPTAFRAIKEFEDLVETTRVTLVNQSNEGKLHSSVETVTETTQDFTDSAYTSHENRERIIGMCEKLKHQVVTLAEIGKMLDKPSQNCQTSSQDLETSILKTREASRHLRKQLQDSTMDQASEVFKTNEDHELMSGLKQCGLQGNEGKVSELAAKFEEHAEQIQEVCKLLRHISGTEALIVWAEHAENITKTFAPQIIHAASVLSKYPNSKIAKENIDVFSEAWATHINDLSILVKDVNDVCQGKVDKTVYLSLPRPGHGDDFGDDEVFLSSPDSDQFGLDVSFNSNNNNNNNNNSCDLDDEDWENDEFDYDKYVQKHGTTAKNVRASKLNTEEQAKIAKLGLEMKLITSEMDAETEKWGQESDNEIVCRGKNMSSMAFSMYLFTRGEGPLKTTQDLFTQAQYFAEEGVRLYQCCKDFSTQVPQTPQKAELLTYLERLPSMCQRLTVTIKAPTVGKTATFTKVDSVVQETKNLMNCVSKVVTTCLVCSTKYGLEYQSRVHHSQWRPLPFDFNANTSGAMMMMGSGGPGPGSDGSDRESVKSSKSLRSSGGSSGGGSAAMGATVGINKRPDAVRRSASLNSRPPPGAHPMQYMSDRL